MPKLFLTGMPKLFLKLILALVFWCLSSGVTYAASIITNDVTVGVGEQIVIPIKLDTEGATVNTISGEVTISGDAVSINSLNEQNSVVSLWVERPEHSADKVTFAGIIPGGFRGVLGAGVNSYEPGIILNIVILGKKVGEGTLNVSITTLVEHAEKQNLIPVADKLVNIRVVEGGESNIVRYVDTEPPELFKPVIVSSHYVSDTGYALVFQTRDVGSGIDHYEVKVADGEFLRAENPYPLDKSQIHSIIYVKAIDRAGNERTVKLENFFTAANSSFGLIIKVVVAFSVVLILFIVFKKWAKHRNRKRSSLRS